MKQECDSFPAPFDEMSEAEIVAYFARYGFCDEHGHKLEMCGGFLDLVALVKAV